MTLESILQSRRFDLPYLISISGKLSSDDLNTILHNFNQEIQASGELFQGIFKEYYSSGGKEEIDADVFKKDIESITNGVLKVIALYLNGSPALAYSHFDETIKINKLKYLLTNRTKILNRNSSFYRLRSDGGFTTPITPLQLFHVPFELRFKIDTKRYSIPGFPCLYVSDSLHIACKEMDIDDSTNQLKSIKAVRLTNNAKLRYLDVAARDISTLLAGKSKFVMGKDDSVILEIFEYALLYPIIAACHTKIDYSKMHAPFKIEYVVPQILLQWFRDNNRFTHGIRYFSNRIDYATGSSKIGAYNYVFPVKASCKDGYCQNLQKIFNSTDVLIANGFGHTKSTLVEKITELQDVLLGEGAKILV